VRGAARYRAQVTRDALFPTLDPIGPASRAAVVPHVDVIADVVAAHAARTDVEGVRRQSLDALAEAGLLGQALEPVAAQRELAELIAGSDAATWFCWVQHQTPLRTVAGSVAGMRSPAPATLREELLPGLRTGRLVGAVAFAHVRRPGPANPQATRVDGGWRLDGTLDWVTSWDIADVVMVMAQGAGADADALVCGILPAGRSGVEVSGLRVGEPLDLLALSATHTRPLVLSDVHVPDDRVAAVLDRSAWLAADAVRTADANPAAFGLARASVAELHHLADQRSDAALGELSAALVEECRTIRAAAYASSDADGPVRERLHLRAASLDLALRAATAVVLARAGAAMRRGLSAERRVREAMFLQVQAQTRATRNASLALLVERSRSAADGVG
jgi:alkylation response protein AidB-like acyl-CoA dehydrogenase